MIRAVEADGRDRRLIYRARSRAAMAFADELRALAGDRVHLVPRDTGGLPDLVGALEDASTRAAVYACGPEPPLKVDVICPCLFPGPKSPAAVTAVAVLGNRLRPWPFLQTHEWADTPSPYYVWEVRCSSIRAENGD